MTTVKAFYLVDASTQGPTSTPLLRVWVAGNPISANHMYAARGYGAARRMTTEAKNWRDAVADSVLSWRFAEQAPRPRLAISCVFHGARADVDNLLKLVVDGIKLGLAVDDRYVVRVCAEKYQGTVRAADRGAWIAVEVLPTPAPIRRTRQPRQKAVTNNGHRSA